MKNEANISFGKGFFRSQKRLDENIPESMQ